MQLQLRPASPGSSHLQKAHGGKDAQGGDEKVLRQVDQLLVELPGHGVHPLGQPHVRGQAAAKSDGRGCKKDWEE